MRASEAACARETMVFPWLGDFSERGLRGAARALVCTSAEERSDVSTRAQCRGQGATPPPVVCGAELGDDYVDLITFS